MAEWSNAAVLKTAVGESPPGVRIPPPPPDREIVNEYKSIIIWAAVIVAVFGFLWWKGHLRRFGAYVLETREELRKCTWPSWAELKGSTVVVVISTALLGGFTLGVDVIVAYMVKALTQIKL